MFLNKDLQTQYNTFSDNVRYYRKLQGITQEILAEKADLSISYIKQIESEKEYKNLSLTAIFKVSKALNIDIKTLFEERDKTVV